MNTKKTIPNGMKKRILLLLFLSPLLAAQAQKNGQRCRLGFNYEISSRSHWGKDKPVIMNVYPHSPAEAADIRPNDVIEKIDGVSVTEISPDDVDSLLTESENRQIELTVSNFLYSSRTVSLTRECDPDDMMTEDHLAAAFFMYSVENTHEWQFTCPFVTTTTNDTVDFLQFGSFDFEAVGDSAISRRIESVINQTLKAELTKKGLRNDPLNPDFLIQTYYSFNKNPHFKEKSNTPGEPSSVSRYDLTRDRVVQLPFLLSSSPEAEAEYILRLGIRFIDRRWIRGRVLWECEAEERMTAPFKIDEYALIHLPLMCMQYPYVKYNRNALFRLSKKAYYYTGIQYGLNRVNEVMAVDPDSPAEKAGIRPRDLIEKINDQRMDYTKDDFTKAYHRFITKTMRFRDVTTRFTSANGFTECMFWDLSNELQITKAFKNNKYKTAFAYLYGFEHYIHPEQNGFYTFHIKRGNQKIQFVLHPVFHSEKTIELD